MANVSVVQDMPRVGRTRRSPRHPFNLKAVKPFQIQPFVCAPVLAGETLQNAMLQARCVTDPLADRLMGSHLEYYLFYVKMTDLDDNEDVENMLIRPGHDNTGLHSDTAEPKLFYNPIGGSQINWIRRCLNRVVATYFRAEGEAANTHIVDGLPVAQVNIEDIRNSYISNEVVEDVDINIGIDPNTANPADGPLLSTEAVEDALRRFDQLRENGLVNMSYDQYLATFGISTPSTNQRIPELIRYTKNWTYPTNTVEPTNGQASTAAVWSVSESANKKRFFREPGFIFGVQIVRPKMYSAEQISSALGCMTSYEDFLPRMESYDAWSSMVERPQNSAPYASATSPYLYDAKDLYLYGEQFVNHNLADTPRNNLPDMTAGLLENPDTVNRYYPSAADIASYFASSEAQSIETDGMATFNILGKQTDTSPTNRSSTGMVMRV